MTQPQGTISTLREAATGQRQRTPYESLKHQLEISKDQFLPLMGHSMNNVEKFVRIVLNAALANPDLIHADRRTFIASCMKAAQDGLMPDGREAVLNIYSTKVKKPGGGEHWIQAVQYLPMVAGYIKALYAHPDVVMVDAAAVYEKDKFTFRRGDDPKLEHEPYMGADAGPVVCAYLVVRLKNGQIKREVMPRRDLDAVRAASKSGDSANGPWNKWFDQQAIKSVIKRGSKQLPKTNQFEEIDRNDNEALGFAATPETLSNIIAGGGQPALRNNPSEVIEGLAGFGPEEREAVGMESAQEGHQEAAQAAPAPETAHEPKKTRQRPQAAEEAPKLTYAVLADRINKCGDREIGLLVLDEARGLPQDQQAGLEKLLNERFAQE